MGMTVVVVVKKVKKPEMDNIRSMVMLTDETIQERLNKVLERMKDNGLSSLVIYADK